MGTLSTTVSLKLEGIIGEGIHAVSRSQGQPGGESWKGNRTSLTQLQGTTL